MVYSNDSILCEYITWLDSNIQGKIQLDIGQDLNTIPFFWTALEFIDKFLKTFQRPGSG